MPTQPYFNAKGERIPGNTTIISTNLGWGKQGLMWWAWDLGMKNMDYRKVVGDAADAGTLGHAMIEGHIKGYTAAIPAAPEVVTKAAHAYGNFLKWKEMVRFELLTMEVPCVSEVLQFGTTIDIIARVNGRRAIVEVKTSNSMHEDMLIQMAAQKFAWDETHPGEPIDEFHLLKLGKEEANFSHHYWGDLPLALEAFKRLRDLHDMQKKIKALI